MQSMREILRLTASDGCKPDQEEVMPDDKDSVALACLMCGATRPFTKEKCRGLFPYPAQELRSAVPECGTLEFWKNEAGRFQESNRQAQETIDDLREQLANAVSAKQERKA